MKILIVFFCAIFQLGLSLKWEDYTVCCHFCRANSQNFVTAKPAWNISTGETLITNFRWPASFFLDDVTDGHMDLLDGSYVLRQAGAPVTVKENGIADAQSIMTSQYIEVDMMLPRAVAGVTIQGGFVEDLGEELLERFESWLTEYVVSITPDRNTPFQYVQDDAGNVQIFKGNKDATTAVMTSFWEPLQVLVLRVHPLGARTPDGPTQHALARVGVVTCHEDTCYEKRIHCETTPWQGWKDCVCDYENCEQKRIRIVHRYNSCGGAACPKLEETRPCDPPFAMWKIIVIAVVCGIVVLILLIVIIAKLAQYCQHKKEERLFRNRNKGPDGENEASTATSSEEIREVDENETDWNTVPDAVKKKQTRGLKGNNKVQDTPPRKDADMEEDVNNEIEHYMEHGFSEAPPPYSQ